jgi:hypothetical protein
MCLVGLFVVTAYGQETVLSANIPFSFIAGEKTMPAGTYTFQAESETAMLMRNVKTGDAAYVTILTRLSPTSDMQQALATFDDHEGKMTLEAVWPTADDGYLFHVTNQKHTHKVIKMT